MTRTYMAALALIVALIAGMGSAPPAAHADPTGVVVIGCDFLVDGVDGDASDATEPADVSAACDGDISAADAANLAIALGNADGVLVAADFAAIDRDANQIEADATPAGNRRASTYVFAFVDDDAAVTFDTPIGFAVSFGADETCDTLAEDADCIPPNDGDGVVVANVTVTTASAGLVAQVAVIQEGLSIPAQIVVTGVATQVELNTVSGSAVETNATGGYAACVAALDAGAAPSFSAQAALPNILGVRARVYDNGGTPLTRVPVSLESGNVNRLPVPNEAASNTGMSVDFGNALGIGYFALLCGGTQAGFVSLLAISNKGTPDETSATVFLYVLAPGTFGPPARISLAASPDLLRCNGVQSSGVAATVLDAADRLVADGTGVSFSVVANATANPVNATTTGGVATSEITPVAGTDGAVTVVVTAGDAQAEVRIACEPDGDDPLSPLSVYSLPFSDFRLTNGMTRAPADPQPCGNIGADIWYQLTIVPSPPFDATLVADTVGSAFDTVVAVYRYAGSGAPPSVFSSIFIDCNANGANSSVTFDVSAGNTYFFQVGGASGATGGLQFNIQCAADADCDTVADAADNCLTSPNVNQLNTDSAPIVIPGVVPIDGTIANSDTQGDACDADDDNDGIPDAGEPAGCNGSGPLNALLFDSDGDRTGDAAECALGSNPGNTLSKPQRPMPSDTDGDGLPDALETAIGSNPAVVDTDGDGIHDGIEYRGYNTSLTATDTDGDACADDTEVADVTGSRKVDVVDLFLIAGSFGLTTRPNFDISKDGSINVVDLFLVAANATQAFCPPQ